MLNSHLMETLLWIAGLGQIVLSLGSLFVPIVLHWKNELQKVRPLVRQIFWTYAGYILVTNISFGMLSVASPSSLINETFLASCVTAFIALHWLARLIIQFVVF